MNQKQRDYLIKQLDNKARAKIREIESLKPKPPSYSSFIKMQIVAKTAQIKPIDDILESIYHRVMIGEELFPTGWSDSNKIQLPIINIFVIPEELQILIDDYNQKCEWVDSEIKKVKNHWESLEMRIQLANDKNLQGILDDVDSMGVLSLNNGSMKLLGGE